MDKPEQTATRETGSFLLTVPITKVDKEQRLVSGPATAEVVDKQGEIVDYATAKKFFENPELWPGNIREMHQPKAVGKKFDVTFDDANKEIILTAKVSKGAPETWEKVLDGTLSMYSIGGAGTRVSEKTADGKNVKRLFLESLAEVSLVDNGACPAAKFEVIKSVDGKITDAQPEEPAEVLVIAYDTPSAIRLAMKALARTPADQRVIAKSEITLAAAKAPDLMAAMHVVKAFRGSSYDIDQALAAVSMLEHLIEWEGWEASQESADPDDVAQVGMLKGAIELVLEFLRAEFEEQFETEPDPLASIGGIQMSVKALGLVKAAQAYAAAFPTLVQKKGARHSKADADMIQKMHDTALDLGAKCMKDADGDDDDDADKLAKAATEKAVTDEAARLAAAKASAIAEAAPVEKTEAPAAAEIPAADPTPAPTSESETVQKLTTALADATKALKEQGDTIATLKTQVEAIQKVAVPGGPVVRHVVGVTKRLGNSEAPADPNAMTPELLTKVAEALASGADEKTKSIIAAQVVKAQMATGMNRIELSPR